MNSDKKFVLASSSKTRLALLKQVHFHPDEIIAPEIDENVQRGEKIKNIALRLAKEKAMKAATQISGHAVILAADSVLVAPQQKILDKCLEDQDVRDNLSLISGKKHVAFCGICVLEIKENEIVKKAEKLVFAKVKCKRLTEAEIDFHIQTKEGIGKAGGYSIFGNAARFFIEISGSPSTIAGLSLYEALNMLQSFGVMPKI